MPKRSSSATTPSILREDLDAGRIDLSDVVDSKGRALGPVHPGEYLREELLEPLGITAYRLAKSISVPQTRIAAILSGERSITADTALRLGRFFGMTPEFWLGLQQHYDLATARSELAKRLDREVVPLARAS